MSSSAGFPINDLLRRRVQTGIVITTLTLSIASTLFLLLFSSRLGIGIASASNTLTLGLTTVFTQFITFIGILIFIVGAILTSFIVSLMMAQRTRDFGLIKAAGCPNSLVGGYFMTELLSVATISCLLGLISGFLADYIVVNIVFGDYALVNWWFAPLIFVLFFGLIVFFGLQPILKASRLSAAEAISPVNYYGLIITGKSKILSHSKLTWRIASRSMVRRISPTARMVIMLSTVFLLLTITVAGGIIANDTTTSWLAKTTAGPTIAIAYNAMGEQYELLLSKFTGTQDTTFFNYSDRNLAIPAVIEDKISSLSAVTSVEKRLILYKEVTEISNSTAINGNHVSIGGNRQGTSLVIGIDPQNMVTTFSSKGQSITSNIPPEAVIGDSIAQTMYYPDKNLKINLSEPLSESIKIENTTFRIVGVCIDALNNGHVTYVPLDKLIDTTIASGPNLLLATLNESVDRTAALLEIENTVKSVDPALEVFDLRQTNDANTAFLHATWQTVMFIPLVTLVSAIICLVGYMMLFIDEQRQEFTVLRAVGVRPKLIIEVSAIQSMIVLLGSFGVGTSFGVITTLMTLMADPLITSTTIAIIMSLLISTLLVMFTLSLYPAIKLSKTSILKIAT